MVQVGEYTSLAFLLPAATFVGYAIGYLLDKAFGTHFWYLVFLLSGNRGGIRAIDPASAARHEKRWILTSCFMAARLRASIS